MEGSAGAPLDPGLGSAVDSAVSGFAGVGASGMVSVVVAGNDCSSLLGALEGVTVVDGLGVTGAVFAGPGRLTFSLSSPYSFHSSTSSKSYQQVRVGSSPWEVQGTYAYKHPKSDETRQLSFPGSSSPQHASFLVGCDIECLEVNSVCLEYRLHARSSANDMGRPGGQRSVEVESRIGMIGFGRGVSHCVCCCTSALVRAMFCTIVLGEVVENPESALRRKDELQMIMGPDGPCIRNAEAPTPPSKCRVVGLADEGPKSRFNIRIPGIDFPPNIVNRPLCYAAMLFFRFV